MPYVKLKVGKCINIHHLKPFFIEKKGVFFREFCCDGMFMLSMKGKIV